MGNSTSPWQQEELKRVLEGRLIEEPHAVLGPGREVRLKSGTEGWVKATIVEYFDVLTYPALRGAIYGGGMAPGYKVHILEGKHAGETIRVPESYVEPVSTEHGYRIVPPAKSYTPSPWR